MKTNYTVLILLCISIFYSCDIDKSSKTYKNKLSGINPLTYTDVVYAGTKDSAFVSTFSGRVALRVKGNPKEKVITKIDDEIYALAYSKKREEIIVATNSLGILIIDSNIGKIKHKLKISNKTWTLNVFLSDDETELYAFDLNGVNYVWNANDNYSSEKLPENFPKTYLRTFKNNNLYFSNRGQISIWDKSDNKLIKESKTKGSIKDVDENGDILLLDDNTFIKYSLANDTVMYSKTHPSWIRVLSKGDTIRNSYAKLILTSARFAKDKILTAGADRSIRVWDSKTGKLLKDIIGHSASITAIDITKNNEQFVSVDAKGGIKFWELN
jgi:WD40 repeat protein